MTNFQLFLEFIQNVKGPAVRDFYNEAMTFVMENLDEDRVDLVNNTLTYIDQQDSNAIVESVHYSFSDMCAKYLGDLGIIVDDEMIKGENYTHFYELLRATSDFYTTEQHDDILSSLNEDEQDLEVYLELLSRHTTKDESFWSEWIDEVYPLFIEKMNELHRNPNEEVEEAGFAIVEVNEELLSKVTEESALIIAVAEGDIKSLDQLDAYVPSIEALDSLEEQALHLIIGADAVKTENPLDDLKKLISENYESFNKVIKLTKILTKYYGA